MSERTIRFLKWITGFKPMTMHDYDSLVGAFESLISANQEELSLIRNDIHALVKEFQNHSKEIKKDEKKEDSSKMDNSTNMYS